MNGTKKRQAKKSNGGSKLGAVNVKMTSADRKRLTANARRYAKGNLSAWIRHSGQRYTPKAGEKIKLKAA